MSMRTETLQLVISGDGKLLGAALGRSERQVKTFAGRMGGMFTGVGKKFAGAVGKLSPLALIGGTGGILMAARDIINYQDAISSLGISAGLSTERMMALEKQIQSAAYTTGQSRDKLLAAVTEVYDKTSDIDYAVAAFEHVGKASTAMSADITQTARVLGAFKMGMNVTNEEAQELFDTMARMGSMGTFGFAQQAANAEKLFTTSATMLGITKDNFAEYSAFLQTIKPMFGSGEQTASAVERIATQLSTDPRKRRAIGFNLFDADGNVKDFKKLIERISSMSERHRRRLFGNYSRAFMPFTTAQGREAFDNFIKQGTEAGFVSQAFSRKQQEARFQLNALSSAAKEFAGVALSPILADLTAKMNELTGNPAAMEEFRNNLVAIGEAVGAIGKGVSFVAKGLKGWSDFWGNEGSVRVKEQQVNKIDRATRNELMKKHGLTFRDRKDMDWKTWHNRTDALLDDYHMNYRSRPAAGALQSIMNQARLTSQMQRIAIQSPDVRNHINLNVQVTPDDRVISQSDDSNTSITTKCNRGVFR